ncbi:hypothetical protein, partial [Ideonella sp.]|uniref:hypothetical protein n=1 Tax=Ideonella sp. TaxID=1929293 RepID=UPI002B45F72B
MPTSLRHRLTRAAAALALASLSLATLPGHAEDEAKPDAPPKKAPWNVNSPPGEARTVTLDTR